MKSNFSIICLTIALFTNSCFIQAQDDRAQIPTFMQKTYFEVNVGAMNFPFGQQHLEAGYTFSSVVVPPTAVRLVLFGYDFNDYLSAQVTYMRPVIWVQCNAYDNNSPNEVIGGSIRMNVGGLTLKPHVTIGKKFSIYGEAGLGIVTRNGFEDGQGNSIVTNDGYATTLYGAGVKYHINNQWALQLVANYSPANAAHKQPYTTFVGTGFAYNYRAFAPEKLKKAEKLGYIHPKQWVQLGYSSNALGYGVNNFLEKACVFWGGEAEVKQGLTLNYQRNIFHGPAVFALDLGIEAGMWQTNKNEDEFVTVSVYPVFRLNFLRTKNFDAYFYYSIAAPAFMSKTILDDAKMGEKFTFQDNMGTGVFFGKERNYNAEIKIGHYSNGNIFPDNEAVKIPLSLNVGYAF